MDGSNKAIPDPRLQDDDYRCEASADTPCASLHAHGFAVDSKGNLFIGEVNNGQRYYKYRFTGKSWAIVPSNRCGATRKKRRDLFL